MPATPVFDPDLDDVLTALDAALDSHLDDLVALATIPSISADPDHAADVIASAEACRDLLRRIGLEDADVVSADGGGPAVVATWDAARQDAPTELLYAHHEVQSVGPSWTRPPFDPSIDGEQLYGRGTADDKAGVLVHVAALAAWRSARGTPPVNVRVLLEDEKEIESPTLGALLAAEHQRLAADVLPVCDGLNQAAGIPALTWSLRGRVNAEVEVSATRTPVHSRVVGGLVRDPLLGLTRMLAGCVDDAGENAIAGLADDVHVPTTAEGERIEALGFDETAFRRNAGVRESVELRGGERHPLEMLWLRPALSIEGLDAPAVDGAASILVERGRARVRVRLAPGQDPERAR